MSQISSERVNAEKILWMFVFWGTTAKTVMCVPWQHSAVQWCQGQAEASHPGYSLWSPLQWTLPLPHSHTCLMFSRAAWYSEKLMAKNIKAYLLLQKGCRKTCTCRCGCSWIMSGATTSCVVLSCCEWQPAQVPPLAGTSHSSHNTLLFKPSNLSWSQFMATEQDMTHDHTCTPGRAKRRPIYRGATPKHSVLNGSTVT